MDYIVNRKLIKIINKTVKLWTLIGFIHMKIGLFFRGSSLYN